MRIDEGLYFVLSPYAYNSQNIRGRRCMVGWIYINLWNQYLSPKVVSLNSTHDNVHSMQYYVVNLLMTWDCFLRLLQKIFNTTAILLKSPKPRTLFWYSMNKQYIKNIQAKYYTIILHTFKKHLIILLFCIWFFTFIKMYTFEVFCFILFIDKFNILYLHF